MRYFHNEKRSASYWYALPFYYLSFPHLWRISRLLFIISALSVQRAFSHCMVAISLHSSDLVWIKLWILCHVINSNLNLVCAYIISIFLWRFILSLSPLNTGCLIPPLSVFIIYFTVHTSSGFTQTVRFSFGTSENEPFVLSISFYFCNGSPPTPKVTWPLYTSLPPLYWPRIMLFKLFSFGSNPRTIKSSSCKYLIFIQFFVLRSK